MRFEDRAGKHFECMGEVVVVVVIVGVLHLTFSFLAIISPSWSFLFLVVLSPPPLPPPPLQLPSKLFFSFTHLVCRTAAETEAQKTRDDLSHPIHSDNCNLLDDGTCIYTYPAFTWRDFRLTEAKSGLAGRKKRGERQNGRHAEREN